jgi:hypothetical protein
MFKRIGRTGLRRSVDLHPYKHSRAEVGNTKRHGQKNRGEDCGLDRSGGPSTTEKATDYVH